MSARTILDRAWNDSVWSKVIATAITAALAGLLGSLAGYVNVPETLHGRILRRIDAPVTLPAWSLAALGLVIVVLAIVVLALSRRRGRGKPAAEDIQPNAVPVIEARALAWPSPHAFDARSEEPATSPRRKRPRRR